MQDLKLLFGIAAYVAAVATALWTAVFLGNVWIARTVDAAAAIPLSRALLVNLTLIALFALQHAGMARWRFGGCHARSIYVFITCFTLCGVLVFWQPMGGIVWMSQSGLLVWGVNSIYIGGWMLMVYATFLRDHFGMFGLRQSWTARLGGVQTGTVFQTPCLYRRVRHPIYLGWLIVLWAAPVMTVSRFLFAAGLTIYVVIRIQIDEHALARSVPEYAQYQRKVPMLVPSLTRGLSDR